MKQTLSVVLAVLVLTGCGGGPRHQPSERYYLVCANPKIPYWQEAGAGLVKAARELNVQAELVGPDVYDAKSELAEFQRIMANKPAGILVSPGDSDVLRPQIDAAMAAGVPVITVDSDAPQSQRLFFIGTNNYQAGQMGGDLLVKLLHGKGDVIFFTIANQKNLEERLDGYRAALASSPGIRVVQVIDMKGDARVAFDKTMAIVEKKTPVDAFVSLESLSGSEIAEVLDREKVEGKTILAMDTAASTLGWIQKGKIAATLMQRPFTMGYYGLKTLAGIVLEKQASSAKPNASDPQAVYPVFIDTGTMLVDKSNVAEVKR